MAEETNKHESKGVVMSRTSFIRCFSIASALAAAFFAAAASANPRFPLGQQQMYPPFATAPRGSYESSKQSDRFRRQVVGRSRLSIAKNKLSLSGTAGLPSRAGCFRGRCPLHISRVDAPPASPSMGSIGSLKRAWLSSHLAVASFTFIFSRRN